MLGPVKRVGGQVMRVFLCLLGRLVWRWWFLSLVLVLTLLALLALLVPAGRATKQVLWQMSPAEPCSAQIVAQRVVLVHDE